METCVDKFGRIVIPKRIRDALGLVPGTAVRVREEGAEIVLSVISDEPEVDHVHGVLVYRGEPAGDVEEAAARGRAERLHRLMSRGRAR